MDKTKLYELNAPIGSWVGTMKVNNDVIWNDFIKTGKVKGFSIEGYFADKATLSLSKVNNEIEEEIEAGLDLLEIQSLFDNYGNPK